MKHLLFSLLLACSAFAGDATPTPTPINARWDKQIIDFAQGAQGAKSFSVEVHTEYAQGLPIGTDGKTKNPFGGGGGVMYPIGDYVYAYLGADWFGGEWFAVSGQVGLHADVTIEGFKITPSVFVGSHTPLAGAGDKDKTTGAIVGAAALFRVWQSSSPKHNIEIDLFGGYKYDTNFPDVKFWMVGPIATFSL